MEFRAGDEAAMTLGETSQVGLDRAGKPGKAMTMDRKDAGSEDLIAAAAGDVLLEAAKAASSAVAEDSKAISDRRFTVVTDPSRDDLLTGAVKPRYVAMGARRAGPGNPSPRASATDQCPNQRARRMAPNCSFSAAYSSDGS